MGEPKKDSNDKRVNFDNTREDKFKRDVKTRGKGKERRPRRTGRDEKNGKDAERKSARMTDCRSNDIAWYTRNGELLKSSTQTNFVTTTGLRPPLTNATAVPGIMTIEWSPVFGSQANDAMNQAANSDYSFVVHANSRNYSYDAPDLMCMYLAGYNVFALIAAGLRAYGTMREFQGQDRYTPQALVQAMGFNYDDLQKNMSQMWFDLNLLIARTKQIWVPDEKPLLKRWYWMNSYIYKDGESAKAQYYMFVQVQYYKFANMTGSQPGSSLVPVAFTSNTTWAAFMSMANDLIESLLNMQDRGIIMGDVLKAYGPEKIFAMNEISSDYRVSAVYDQEVLTQIENATVLGFRPGSVITDANTNTLEQQWPEVDLANIPPAYQCPRTQVLNFHQKEAPTSEQIMIATRLKCASNIALTYTGGENPKGQLAPWTYGTEVVTGYAVYSYSWATGSPVLSAVSLNSLVKSGSGATIAAGTLYQYNAFDWAPWIYTGLIDSTITAAFTKVEPSSAIAIGDYDNYAYISDIELDKMNVSAVYSEFGVPTI